jgi:hypothetical protein
LVQITEEDVRKATHTVLSPLGVALRRQFPELGRWKVGLHSVYLDGRPVPIPHEARQLLYHWEKTGEGYPLTFKVHLWPAHAAPPTSAAAVSPAGAQKASPPRRPNTEA